VRAVYNHESRGMLINDNVDMWCPFELFRSRLLEMSMTAEQYKEGCSGNERQTGEKESNARRAMEAEIRATIDGLPRSAVK